MTNKLTYSLFCVILVCIGLMCAIISTIEGAVMLEGCRVKLTRGMTALVDEGDFAFVSQWKWCASRGSRNQTWYAVRGERRGGVYRGVSMHRAVAMAKPGEVVDHINHDTLDNRRKNLRVGTRRLNQLNRHPNAGSSSKYKGVSWYGPARKWVAHYRSALGSVHLGYWDDEADAARAYNSEALKHGGDWSLLNEIPGMTRELMVTMPDLYHPRVRAVQRYRGVRQRSKGSWEYLLQVSGERHRGGRFKSEGEAVWAYNAKCAELGCGNRVVVL